MTKQTPFNRPIRHTDPDYLLTRPEKRRASKDEARREALFSDIRASLREREGPMRLIRKADRA